MGPSCWERKPILLPKVPLPSPGPAPAPTWSVAGGPEASASPGAWDPAELERVGPTGQDLESERGTAPGTGTRGDLPSRLSQSCSPTVIVGWGLPPRPQLPDTVVRTKSSGQPASLRLCSSAPHPCALLITKKGCIPSDCQSRGRFQETMSPMEQDPASLGSDLTLPDIPYPSLLDIGGRLGTLCGGEGGRGSRRCVRWPGRFAMTRGEAQRLAQSLAPNAQSGAGLVSPRSPVLSLGTPPSIAIQP